MQYRWKTGLAVALSWIASVTAEPALAANGMKPNPYSEAVIVSPANDSALRSNAGNLTVRGQVHPGLRGGHRVQFLLDGVAQGVPGRRLDCSLENIHRGTHRLEIRIVDEAGEVVFTGAPSTVHLLRHSRLHP